jgi:hypothetical protein
LVRFGAASLALALLGLQAARATVVTSQGDPNPNSSSFADDGVISVNEYPAVYTGGGSGFGGTLGNGAIYMDSDTNNVYIGFQPGNSLNDNVVIHLDTKSGGFTDAQMNDTADPGRNLLTNLTRDVDDPFPVLPDYGIVIGQFGEVSFELTAGSLNFISFQGDQTGNNAALAREFAIPKSSIGNPSQIQFFVSYGSDTNFMSNESVPADAFNAGPNPGFDNNGTFLPVVHSTNDQFLLPEPGSIALLAIGGVACLGRRRRSR